MITALVALIRDHSLFGESPIPIGVQILAFSLMVWARVTFGGRSFHAAANPTAGGVVTSGPYRFVRHPIYAAVIYFTWAGVLSHLSILNLVLGICAIAGAGLRLACRSLLLSAFCFLLFPHTACKPSASAARKTCSTCPCVPTPTPRTPRAADATRTAPRRTRSATARQSVSSTR